eukprot:CAMPEP_0184692634 /NCGR_PEP_ID=MMETSP0313-20130426/1030_1 /TAXON_ID=2792 /ORGANISM="Porphyridium aerugineum, Strain SAG 1380-2" /LENGTH=215 /DNA_ID=CAMNT_0027150475 /DNA_START=107 /DNA_END=754 /DNA_ORIENTATION=+
MGRIDIATLLANNEKFRKDTLAKDPKFFEKQATGQTPTTLWIGCADSRCPGDQIVKAMPGEIFETRNIANCVVHSDLNMMSVIEYAVKYLKVKKIVVCGHYACGGIHAALSGKMYGSIDNWLRHIKDEMRNHEETLNSIHDEEEKFKHMCEIHAIEGALAVADTQIVQEAWSKGQELSVHAMVYDLATGTLKDMGVSINSAHDVNPIFAYKAGGH